MWPAAHLARTQHRSAMITVQRREAQNQIIEAQYLSKLPYTVYSPYYKNLLRIFEMLK